MAVVVPFPDNNMLQAALQLARIGAHIIPIWWPTVKGCACGNIACQSPGKHPIQRLVPHGIKNATNDPQIITQLWAAAPQANIAVACGRISGVIVLDVDGPKGWEALQWVLSLRGETLASEWMVETGREQGRHFWFAYPDHGTVLTHKIEGLELRSDGAYVVAPPSIHASGKVYKWLHVVNALPQLPAALLDFGLRKLKLSDPQPVAANPRSVNKAILAPDTARAPPSWSEAEENKILEWLKCIPSDDRDVWLKVGAGLHWTGWGARARQICDVWSQESEKYNEADQQKTRESFSRPYDGPKITLGTIRYLADMHGYKPPVDDAIAEINERFFLIRNIGGKCLIGEFASNEIGTGKQLSLQTTESFSKWLANRTMKIGTKLYPLGPAWMASPHRRTYDRVVLEPDEPEVTKDGCLNLWRGFGVEPKKGNWPLLREHVYAVLAKGDEKAAEYISRWVAWSLQHPGERAEVALVLQGGKGSGKGGFLRAVARCFGEHSMQITYQEHLVGRFNGHLRSCLYLFVDEAFWAGDKKGESVFKGLLTEDVIMIEQKGIDAVQWRNRLHVAMAANADWVVPASAGERRYAVFKCADTYVRGHGDDEVSKAYFKALYHELNDGGREAMLYDLLHWDLGDWHPRQVYETGALRQQKEQSLTPLAEWYVLLLEDGKLPGNEFCPGKRDFATTRALVEDAKQRVPRLTRYLSDKAVAMFLREHGCTSEKDKSRNQRGWRFPRLSQMRAEWARKYGGWTWDSDEDDWQ